MLARSLVLCAVAWINLASGQSCWRNTTCTGPLKAAFEGEWDADIYAPISRTVQPKAILAADGVHTSNFSGYVILNNNGSSAVLDFGIEVGGLVSFAYNATSSAQIGIAFTEAKNWIGEWSDSSNGAFKGPDGALYANIPTNGSGAYLMPEEKLRGGFRYMTVFLITKGTSSVNISDINLEIGFQPTWSNLRAYQGYFRSDDVVLNKIWYSGAYTLQTNAVPVNTGRQVPMLHSGWANNGTLGPGDTIIVDGAKRDRAVWPGDMGIAVPSSFVSIGDLDSVKNALQVMYDHQNSDGSFPEAGPPLLQQGSDTYHMWSMIGTYNYVLYSNDTSFLLRNWNKYLKAMDYVYHKVGASGLLNVTGTRDWARWQQGFNNSEANMILYRTLFTGSSLATWSGDKSNLSSTYLSRASALRTAINSHCWDASYGAFKDNATATNLHPQDANSMAILFNVSDSSRVQSISEKLLKNWTPIGAETPELPGNISPFISSFEIQAHFTAGRADRALELIRRSWGWYLNNANGTGSTVIEGYLTDGSFGYRSTRGYSNDPSYVSHAHGWSSGPTSALTEYVLGLSVTGPAGSTWSLKPQFGNLKNVEGGFVTKLGKYSAGWKKTATAYSVSLKVPTASKGELLLPSVRNGTDSVQVNGKQTQYTVRDGGLYLALSGGDYEIIVG